MPENQLKHFKILFVEDEDKIREHIARSLSYLVDEVRVAANGQQALDVLQNFSPDIIMTDLEMPIMNGVELIKEVRKTNKDIPIVVLTAHTNNDYLLELINMHIEYFIIKPMNFEKLLDVLKKCQIIIEESKSLKQELPEEYNYDWNQKILLYKNEEIKLTKKEILFLELLFKYSHRVVTYNELEKYVWESGVMTDNSVRSLIRNLRKKLPINLIKNLSGIGYKLV